MAVITIVVNILVIIVLSTSKRLRNSQSTYKISLALADLFVGMIVMPTCMYSLAATVGTRLTTDIKRTVNGYQLINDSYVEAERVIGENIYENLRKYSLTPAYINAVGFITAISIFVSVYTFAGAGLDRFKAVYRPLSYDRVKANRIAKIVCLFSWLIALIISAFPIFTPENVSSYGINFSLIVATLGEKGFIFYIIIFFIPLFAVWAVNISVYVVIKRHNAMQRRSSSSSRTKAAETEKQLASTLQLMVGVFTINTLPLWVILFSSLFISGLAVEDPESFQPKTASIVVTMKTVSVFLLLGNSLCNFFVYNSRSEEFRKSLKANVLDKLGLTACWTKTHHYLHSTVTSNTKL